MRLTTKTYILIIDYIIICIINLILFIKFDIDSVYLGIFCCLIEGIIFNLILFKIIDKWSKQN